LLLHWGFINATVGVHEDVECLVSYWRLVQDHQMSEYLQIKKRNTPRLPEKIRVKSVGQQHQDVWVLGPDCHISHDGKLLTQDENPHVWISHLYAGPGEAPHDSTCKISLPLNIEALPLLMDKLKDIMQHNFISSLLVLGACAMSLHYNTIVDDYIYHSSVDHQEQERPLPCDVAYQC